MSSRDVALHAKPFLAGRYHSRLLDIISVIWLLAAATNKRSIYRESGGQRLRYSILLVLAFLLLTKRHRLPYPLNVGIISGTEAVEWVAGVLCIAGFAFCVWARATLGRNWSGTITLKEGHELH